MINLFSSNTGKPSISIEQIDAYNSNSSAQQIKRQKQLRLIQLSKEFLSNNKKIMGQSKFNTTSHNLNLPKTTAHVVGSLF